MKEIKVAEWIFKGRKDNLAGNLTFRVPNDVTIPKGIYLIKVYRLESED